MNFLIRPLQPFKFGLLDLLYRNSQRVKSPRKHLCRKMQVELQGSVLMDHETYCVIVSEEDIEMYLQKMFVISSL